MSTFGEDLIQSLNEALAHSKGEGPVIVHAPVTPREVRVQAKLTQSQMATLMGVSLSGYRKWEQGARRVSGPAATLLRIIQQEPAAVSRALLADQGGPGVNRYDAYDPFARVYDQHWGFFAKKAYPIIEHLVLENLPPGCAVLDLCCGTGQLAAELSRQGYRTTGLDGSEGMIEIARKNAPDADFVVQDARNIALPGRFSAVLSTFDSLNHVMSLDELEQVFQSVFAVLEGGGYFVFDLNMEEGFRSRWRGSFEFIEEDHVCVVRSSHDASEKTGRLDVTLFEMKGSGWVRTDFPLIQRWYEEHEIRERLRKAGFEELESFDGNEPLLEGSLHKGRMFFVARKRDAHQPRSERRPDVLKESVAVPDSFFDPLPDEELKSWEGE